MNRATFAILNFVLVLSVLFRLSCDHIISVLSRSAQQEAIFVDRYKTVVKSVDVIRCVIQCVQ